MPIDATSPFTPGRPVPVEFFVGRREEIERLRRKVRDAIAAPRVEVAFVGGERGIGKSSLASFVRHLCEKEHAALGIHALMGGVDTVEAAVKRILDQLLKEHSEGSLFGSIRGLFGKHVREVGLFGVSVEFTADDRELKSLATSFAPALRNLLASVGETRKGILLILDDINGLAESRTFANWFKSFVDEISTSRQPLALCVMFVGLEERRWALIKTQPSLARVFDPVQIKAWSDDESRDFFEKTLEKAGLRCRREAVATMTRYAGGLPMLAHEIGDAVFRQDRDGVVDTDDALQAVVSAAEIVGRRYLDPIIFDSLRNPKYRRILKRMAGRPSLDERFTRAEIRELLPEDQRSVFDNFLVKMKKLGVIVDDVEGGRGAYRFGTLLHYVYFVLQAPELGINGE